MLAPPISNDWSKMNEIQQAALKMPEALTGLAHFTEDAAMESIFMNTDAKSAKEWEDAYNELWNEFDQYVYTIENEEEEDEWENANSETAYWECESTAPGSQQEAETWYETEWDSNWEEGEAYFEYDEEGYPIYYEDEADDSRLWWRHTATVKTNTKATVTNTNTIVVGTLQASKRRG